MNRIFSFPGAICALLVVLAEMTVMGRFDDPDMWWHLKMGETIWKTHRIPTADLFSYTTNHYPYIAHEWLSQLLIYAAYHYGGYSGLMLWLVFFASAVFIAGYALCSLYSGNAKVALLGAMTIWLFSTIGLSIRPQMIGYLLLVIELLFLHLGRTRDPRWFLALPPLFVFWVNCHGSFLLGIVVACMLLFSSWFEFRAGSLVAQRWKPKQSKTLAAAIALSVAGLFLNPVGAKLVFYPLNILLNSPVNLSSIVEWRPLQLNEGLGIALCGVTACIILMAIVQRTEIFFDELLILIFAIWMSASHERLIFVFGILAGPILSRVLANSWDGYDPGKDRPLPNVLLMAASLSIVWFAFPSHSNLKAQAEEHNPVKAVDFIKSHHLSGPMMNEYIYGGYMIWAAPEYPVFVDGRTDIFEWTGVLSEYGRWILLQTDPNILLDKYHVNFCLLTRNSAMAKLLPLMGPWKVVYSDKNSVILVRSGEGAVR